MLCKASQLSSHVGDLAVHGLRHVLQLSNGLALYPVFTTHIRIRQNWPGERRMLNRHERYTSQAALSNMKY